jgi:hypothetical protein
MDTAPPNQPEPSPRSTNTRDLTGGPSGAACGWVLDGPGDKREGVAMGLLGMVGASCETGLTMPTRAGDFP